MNYNSYLSANLRLMIIAPDKITTPANTSAAPVASPVFGRPGLSSVVVVSEGAGTVVSSVGEVALESSDVVVVVVELVLESSDVVVVVV